METDNEKKIELKYVGMSEVLGTSDVFLIMLVNEVRNLQLVVTCDKTVQRQLMLRMMHDHEKQTQYMLPEVFYRMLDKRLILFIYAVYDGEYEACLQDVDSGKSWRVRCSDGILMAVSNHLPIYASIDLMRHQGASYNPLSGKVAIPINILSEELLKKALDEAIEQEDYERASLLRDALKKRTQNDYPTEES